MKQFDIQSDEKYLDDVAKFIYELCDEMHILNYEATISMPVLQAVENAIVHGNHKDLSKIVHIECDDVRGGLSFLIQDQGNGFDFSKYGDILDNGGNGIFMMRKLSDKLEFLDGGRTVRMEFMIQGIEKTYAMERVSKLRGFFAVDKAVV
ncbi:MAG: ATP-binding protein [Bacteroidales bacterium]|nr:ATP-binding protein [Bacteroidales bacterium]